MVGFGTLSAERVSEGGGQFLKSDGVRVEFFAAYVEDPAAPAAAAPDPRDQVRAQLNAILADTAKRDTLSKKLDKASGKSAVDLIAEAVSDEAATADALQALLTRCGRLFGGGQA